MKNKFITTIEFSEKFIKVLQAEIGDQIILTYCAARELSGNSEEEASRQLREMVSGCKNGSGLITGIIPRRLVIARQVSLPSHMPEEIRRMVAFEVGRYVPYSKEEMVYDYLVCEKTADGFSRILLVVVKKDIIRSFLNKLQQAGVTPQRIIFSSLALAGVSAIAVDQGAVAIIHLEPSLIEICFCQSGTLLFSRVIDFDMTDLIKDPAEFLDEVSLTFNAYEREKMGGPLSKIHILPEREDLGFVASMLKEKMGFPVEMMDPWKEFERPPGMSIIMLGFLQGESNHLNLLPDEFNKECANKQVAKELRKCGILFLLLMFVHVVALEIHLYRNALTIKQMNIDLKKMEIVTKPIEGKLLRLGMLRQNLTHRMFINDLLEELFRLAPPEVAISLLGLNDHTVVLEGIAKTGSAFNDFQNHLVGSPKFRDVVLLHASKRKNFNEDVTDFKIKGELAQ